MTALDGAASSDLAAAAVILCAPFVKTLLSLGSTFSLASLACALLIAVTHILLRRGARGRRTSLALLRRLLFPRSVWLSPSTKADLGFLLLNVWVTGTLLAAALWSGAKISQGVSGLLHQGFGDAPSLALPTALIVAISTVASYLAYELGYWIDHYLSHKVPALWAFHKVHHTAEVLTPLTSFRVHPLETLKFHNILALTLGLTNGMTLYLFGPGPHALMIFDQNAIMVVFLFTLLHLQHSQAWMTFGGGLGGLFCSPAHHQIHHSADPRHFGKNLGSFLTIWDRVFGTLHTPDETRPKGLRFGAEGEAPHGVTATLITPILESLEAVFAAVKWPSPTSRRPVIPGLAQELQAQPTGETQAVRL